MLGTLVTNGSATAEGWATSAHIYTVSGYSGLGTLSIEASVQVNFDRLIGSCTGTVDLTVGASFGIWSACVPGLYSETTPASFGVSVDFKLSLHAQTDSAGGLQLPGPGGGIQYTSAIDLFANANAPFKLIFQPEYWYEPLPHLTVTDQGLGDVTYLFQQENLPPLITPEPTSAVLVGTPVLLWGMRCALRKRKTSMEPSSRYSVRRRAQVSANVSEFRFDNCPQFHQKLPGPIQGAIPSDRSHVTIERGNCEREDR